MPKQAWPIMAKVNENLLIKSLREKPRIVKNTPKFIETANPYFTITFYLL